MVISDGFKNTDIGTIPEEWEVIALKKITSLMTNGFVGTVKTHYTNSDDGILYIQGYNVEENTFNFHGIKRVTYEFHKQHLKSKLQADDLLTVQTGDVGLTTIIPRALEGANCHALIITRFIKNKAYPKFYSFYLNSNNGRSRLKGIETGTTMKHINVGDMIHFQVPLPSLTEQQAIAEVLSDTDNLIQTLEKQIAKKRLIKQGVMQKLLTPKDKWEVKTFGEVFEICGGFSATREQLSDDGFCYLHYGDIHGSKRTYIDCSNDYAGIPKLKVGLDKISRKSLLKNGDVVFVDASEDDEGTSRHVVIRNGNNIPFISGLHTIIARSKDETLDLKFKDYCFQSRYIKNQFKFYAVGTKVSGVSKTTIKNINIYIPSIEEQKEIAYALESMDVEIEQLEKKLSKYLLIKQGLMQNLLTGKIRLSYGNN